jgi:anaerobic magnesium-protoporphyrin IX monomethyl ester cyclase
LCINWWHDFSVVFTDDTFHKFIMDIILVNPGDPRVDHVTEHLGIACLSSYVKSTGYRADTLDVALENITIFQAAEILHKCNPKIIGISLLDATKNKGFDLVKKLRSLGYSGAIVVGGYFPTFASEDILRDFSEIDYIVRGEGEYTLGELMDFIIAQKGSPDEIQGLTFRKQEEIIQNPARPLIDNLDNLPFPDRKYAGKVLEKKSQLRVYGTRGCWGQCTFCDIIGLYGTSSGKVWRRKSAKRLVDELEQLQASYHTSYFIFNDDQFLVKGVKSREYIKEFTREISRRNLDIEFELMCRADTVQKDIMLDLKKVGLKRVFLGLESFDPKQLERYKKKISWRQNIKAVITLYKLEINVIASVILADAYTTFMDLLTQFMIIFKMRRRYFYSKHCQISINHKLEIYPGSKVYHEYKNKGLLYRDGYLEGYDFRLKPLTSLRLKLFELEENLHNIIVNPGRIGRNLFNIAKLKLADVKNLLV